jgi:hypothetical protein
VVPRKQQQQEQQQQQVEEPMDLDIGTDVLVEQLTSTPPGVRDIDAEDIWNPQLCGEYAKVSWILEFFLSCQG